LGTRAAAAGLIGNLFECEGAEGVGRELVLVVEGETSGVLEASLEALILVLQSAAGRVGIPANLPDPSATVGRGRQQ